MPTYQPGDVAPDHADRKGVLVIQNDVNATLGYPDYLSYYTDVPDSLGSCL